RAFTFAGETVQFCVRLRGRGSGWVRKSGRAVERLDDRAVRHFPNLHLAVVTAGGDQVAVGADGDGEDLVGMAGERPYGGAAVGIPNANAIVRPAGDE